MSKIKSRKKIPPTESAKELAKRLKDMRELSGYSLQEVAEKLGISKVTVHRYENLDITNIPSDKIEKLAKIYKTTPSYLMGWEDEKGNLLVGNTKKEKLDYDKFINDATHYFNNEKISDEDKKKLADSLQEVFFAARFGNKKKK